MLHSVCTAAWCRLVWTLEHVLQGQATYHVMYAQHVHSLGSKDTGTSGLPAAGFPVWT